MLETQKFGNFLKSTGFDFFTGVPCSWMKNLINYANNDCDYYNAPNEGDAVALAAGAYIAGRKPVVLMQNSGLGNAISPLTSLNAIFKIPTMFFISMRKGSDTEPQHDLMGNITGKFIETMGMEYLTLSTNQIAAEEQIMYATEKMEKTNMPFFFLVEKNTFNTVELKPKSLMPTMGYHDDDFDIPTLNDTFSRYDALKAIATESDTIYLATTGKTGRELYDIKDNENNLYMVGSMGCLSSLGLGIALNTNKKVVLLDGDGALLMRLSAMAMVGQYNPKNLLHVLLDNRTHDTTGGQSTLSTNMQWGSFATSVGYNTKSIYTLESLNKHISNWNKNGKSLSFFNVSIDAGSKEPLGRPTVTPEEVKNRLMIYIKK